MDQSGAVVRVVPGESPQLGTVVASAKAKRGTVTVRWPDGHEESVAGKDPTLRFVPAGSPQVDWYLDLQRLRKDFDTDPATVAAVVIKDSGGAIATKSLKAALVRLGLDSAGVDRAWPKIRKGLVKHPYVHVTGQQFAWSAEPGTPTKPSAPAAPTRTAVPHKTTDRLVTTRKLPPLQALDELVTGKRLTAARKQALADAVRAGLETVTGDRHGRVPPEEQQPTQPAAGTDVELAQLREDNERLQALLRATHQQQVSFRDAQDRQLKIDAVRALAELAIEVEDLALNGADPDILVERVRALVEDNELEPIGQIGDTASFDPEQHTPLSGFPDAGAPVSVVRPGYIWRTGGEDLLIQKAIVA